MASGARGRGVRILHCPDFSFLRQLPATTIPEVENHKLFRIAPYSEDFKVVFGFWE